MANGSAEAAAAHQRMLEEEEEMSNYSTQDLADEWEFKIVRANTGVFRNPTVLEKLCKEEALSGWTLLEKFDNSRVRFKRSVGSRQNDCRLPEGVDPYRTQYGMRPGVFALILIGIIFAVSLGFILLLFLLIGGLISVGGGF